MTTLDVTLNDKLAPARLVLSRFFGETDGLAEAWAARLPDLAHFCQQR